MQTIFVFDDVKPLTHRPLHSAGTLLRLSLVLHKKDYFFSSKSREILFGGWTKWRVLNILPPNKMPRRAPEGSMVGWLAGISYGS